MINSSFWWSYLIKQQARPKPWVSGARRTEALKDFQIPAVGHPRSETSILKSCLRKKCMDILDIHRDVGTAI